MDLKQKILDLAGVSLADPGHFVVDVIILSRQRPQKVIVIVDGDKGITIDDCANVSRSLTNALNVGNDFDDYVLEVTTPGLDHPLKLLRQYSKNVGRNVKTTLKDKSLVQGKMTLVDSDHMEIEEEIINTRKGEVRMRSIPFAEIEKTIVMVSFK